MWKTTKAAAHPLAGRRPATTPSIPWAAARLLMGLLLFVLMAVVAGMDSDTAGNSSADNLSSRIAGWQSKQPAVSPSPLERAVSQRGYLAARSAAPSLAVRERPSPAAKLLRNVPEKNELGLSFTFLVTGEAQDEDGAGWFEISLPWKPNGSRGWVRSAEVVEYQLDHRVEIDLSARRMNLYERGREIRSYPVGIGKPGTPTPTGHFYITSKMRPPDPNTVYGVLALGLNAFADHLSDWPGGGDQIGIHGTNDPTCVGKLVSRGCIRMANEDIVDLNRFAQTGTPVLIRS